MDDPRDKTFLQLCLDKRLLDPELAQRAEARAQLEGRRVTAVLVELGVMAKHTVEAIEREVERACEAKTIAGFRLVRKLGQGGQGTVYLAVQVSLQREVALKIIAPQIAADRESAERFVREARIAAAINHPNVIGIIDAGEEGGQLFMALELITGGDAGQLAARFNGVLPEARALEIIIDCCRGLQALYDARLIHRDIKPANIFITSEGVAKLADLGLARSEVSEEHLTVSGFAIGTPAFMSPEQANGEKAIDIRTDIYSLGATLFALTTGSQPFTGKGPFAIAAKVLTQAVADPRALNPALTPATAALILRAMAKKPEQRFQTPKEMRLALEAAAAGLARADLPPPAPAPVASGPVNATSMTTLLPGPSTPTAATAATASAGRAGARIPSSPRGQHPPTRSARPPRLARPARSVRQWLPAALAAAGVLAVLSVPLLLNRRAHDPSVPAPLLAAGRPPPASPTAGGGGAPAPGGKEAAPPSTGNPPPESAGKREERARRPPASAPPWATATGQDSYGAWADLRIGATTQRLRWIDPGTFMAGSPSTEPGHVPYERQQRTTISKGFWMADSECTQALWQELMASNPASHKGDGRLPVENVLFEQVEDFLQRLSVHTPGAVARLPTRWEWEYVARAGTHTTYYFGDDAALAASYANVQGSGPGHTLPVRSFKPNPWGVYDTVGNVTEWTYGGLAPLYEISGPDPELAERLASKAYNVRGGSYSHPASKCRPAENGYLRSDSRPEDVGFRFLIEQPPQAASATASPPIIDPAPAAPPPAAHEAKPPPHPSWAAATGKDEFGHWADLRIGNELARLRWIAAGSFVMGSPPTLQGRGEWEEQRAVTITQGFWLGDSACTQEVWRTVVGRLPVPRIEVAQLPVHGVSFDDALDFLDKLSQRLGGSVARLPTRAEWEYAARAGTTTAYFYGDDPDLARLYANTLDYGAGKPLPVRSFRPNRWGLYDVMGNVSQWVYGGIGPLPPGPNADPELAGRNGLQVFHLRGGSYLIPAARSQVARGGILPRDSRNDDLGLRILIESRAGEAP